MARVVVADGCVSNGRKGGTAGAEEPLGALRRLVILNRPRFAPGPPVERTECEEQANSVPRRLEPGDHLCGHCK